jgi:Helix-turn-helix domain
MKNDQTLQSHAQRQRLLAQLNIAPVDTLTARRDLDILCPAARVLELRRHGYRIETVWVKRRTDCGREHRVALYVFRSGEISNEQLELLVDLEHSGFKPGGVGTPCPPTI